MTTSRSAGIPMARLAAGLSLLIMVGLGTGCNQMRSAANLAIDGFMFLPESYEAFMLLPDAVKADGDFSQQRYGMAVARYSRLYRSHPWAMMRRRYLMQQGRSH